MCRGTSPCLSKQTSIDLCTRRRLKPPSWGHGLLCQVCPLHLLPACVRCCKVLVTVCASQHLPCSRSARATVVYNDDGGKGKGRERRERGEGGCCSRCAAAVVARLAALGLHAACEACAEDPCTYMANSAKPDLTFPGPCASQFGTCQHTPLLCSASRRAATAVLRACATLTTACHKPFILQRLPTVPARCYATPRPRARNATIGNLAAGTTTQMTNAQRARSSMSFVLAAARH